MSYYDQEPIEPDELPSEEKWGYDPDAEALADHYDYSPDDECGCGCEVENDSEFEPVRKPIEKRA